MKILTNKKDIKHRILGYKENKKTIGFVPTMGALHQGHLSLIEKAKQKNDIPLSQFDKSNQIKSRKPIGPMHWSCLGFCEKPGTVALPDGQRATGQLSGVYWGTSEAQVRRAGAKFRCVDC